MTDPYLAVAAIANDEFMVERLRACVAQQTTLGNVPSISNDPLNQPPAVSALNWVENNKYVWASSPSWGEKWQYALDSNPDAEPGKDPAVITDDDILATVQHLGGMPTE